MRYLHEVVIHHARKVIGRKTVRLEQDKVLFVLLFLEIAVNGIAQLGPPKRAAFEAHHVRLPRGGARLRLGGVDGAAGARIKRRLTGVVEGLLLGLELRGAAEAAVGVARVEERLDVLPVDGEAFRLVVETWSARCIYPQD